MKTLALLLLLAVPALAQDAGREPPLDPRVVQACRFDIHLWCADARLRQECLVTKWPKLADACQDALKTPMKNGGD